MLNDPSIPKQRTQLGLTVAGALLAAAAFVIGVVLPAEYSLDPLGTGRALGLLGLAADGPPAVEAADKTHSQDTMVFELAPFESVEHSYRMARGSSLVYSWKASAELVFNLHGSPDLTPAGAATDYAESFSAGRDVQRQGTYRATFTGRHGWVWENRTQTSVRLQLATAGFFSEPVRSSLSGQESTNAAPALP